MATILMIFPTNQLNKFRLNTAELIPNPIYWFAKSFEQTFEVISQ